ncbi:hypothetical protein J6590_022534 [Homalodisca vitripennis]|nr:hypothetical protein J6590_022534 [Homalodisca vitripennis]
MEQLPSKCQLEPADRQTAELGRCGEDSGVWSPGARPRRQGPLSVPGDVQGVEYLTSLTYSSNVSKYGSPGMDTIDLQEREETGRGICHQGIEKRWTHIKYSKIPSTN